MPVRDQEVQTVKMNTRNIGTKLYSLEPMVLLATAYNAEKSGGDLTLEMENVHGLEIERVLTPQTATELSFLESRHNMWETGDGALVANTCISEVIKVNSHHYFQMVIHSTNNKVNAIRTVV